MNMQNEPIRLPAVVVSVIVFIVSIVVPLINGADPVVVVSAALIGLTGAGGLFAASESKRARTDSPLTLQAQQADFIANVGDAGRVQQTPSTVTEADGPQPNPYH